jgi:hypothetical protein
MLETQSASYLYECTCFHGQYNGKENEKIDSEFVVVLFLFVYFVVFDCIDYSIVIVCLQNNSSVITNIVF